MSKALKNRVSKIEKSKSLPHQIGKWTAEEYDFLDRLGAYMEAFFACELEPSYSDRMPIEPQRSELSPRAQANLKEFEMRLAADMPKMQPRTMDQVKADDERIRERLRKEGAYWLKPNWNR